MSIRRQVYHRRTHTSTGQTPLARWLATLVAASGPRTRHAAAAFLWSATRTVTTTRTVSLHGNTYEVDPALVGRRVGLRPGRPELHRRVRPRPPAEQATPARLRTHVDPKLRRATPAEPGPATGIRYLDAVVADHAATWRGDMSYQPPEHQKRS